MAKSRGGNRRRNFARARKAWEPRNDHRMLPRKQDRRAELFLDPEDGYTADDRDERDG